MRIQAIATTHQDWPAVLCDFATALDPGPIAGLIDRRENELRERIEGVDVFLVDDLPPSVGVPDWLEALLEEARRRIRQDPAGPETRRALRSWPGPSEDGTIHDYLGLYTPSLAAFLSREAALCVAFRKAGIADPPDHPAILLSPERISSMTTELIAELLALAPGMATPNVLARDRTLDFARIVLYHEIGHHVFRADTTALGEALADLFAEHCLDEESRLLHALYSLHLQPYPYSGYQVLTHGRRWLPDLHETAARAFADRSSSLAFAVGTCGDEADALRSVDLAGRHLLCHGASPAVLIAFVGLAWSSDSKRQKPPLSAAQLAAIEALLDDTDEALDAAQLPDASRFAKLAKAITPPTHSTAARLFTSRDTHEMLIRFVLDEIVNSEAEMRDALAEASALTRLLDASPGLREAPWPEDAHTSHGQRLDALGSSGRKCLPPGSLAEVAGRCETALAVGVALTAIDATPSDHHAAALRRPDCEFDDAQLAIRCFVAHHGISKESILALLAFTTSGNENVCLFALDELDTAEARRIVVDDGLLEEMFSRYAEMFRSSSVSAVRRRVLNALARGFSGRAGDEAKEAFVLLKGELTQEEESEFILQKDGNA